MQRIILIFFLGIAPVFAQPTPSARQILETARLQQARQEVDLQGQIREGATVVPFRLTETGPTIKYSFANPPGALLLRLGEKESRLEELSAKGAEKITPARFDQKVRGTAVSYEDLSLRFLYWPNARVIGDDTVRTRACWELELRPPDHDSQYSRVLLWVDKNSGALMQMEGYDWKGHLAKRFEVVSAQKIEGHWFLKQMRIEQMQPGTNQVQTRAYLEIKK